MPDVLARSESAKNHVAGNQPRTTALLTAVEPTPTASAMFFRPRASAKFCAGVFITPPYPHFVDHDKTTFCGLPKIVAGAKLQPMAQGESEFPQIGARLTAIREAFSDLSQKAWAEKHNFQPTQWNNWEKGARRIPVESAERLCISYGLSLDFIYRGRRDGLSENASKLL